MNMTPPRAWLAVPLAGVAVLGAGCASGSTAATSAGSGQPKAGGSRPQVSSDHPRALVDFANCMRRHGYPGFTTPSFPAAGGVDGAGNGTEGPHYDKHSPILRRAVTTCNKETAL